MPDNNADNLNDEVDNIVAAWRTERPDLDVTPLHVLSRISRLSRRLDLARKAAYTQHNLDSWGFDVLTSLRRAGAPYQLTPGQLVAQTLVTSGTMTHRIDRLERSGDVVRQPDPSDRRGILVQLTEQGRTRIDAAFADLLDHERHFLEEFDAEELETLTNALRRLTARMEEKPDHTSH